MSSLQAQLAALQTSMSEVKSSAAATASAASSMNLHMRKLMPQSTNIHLH